MKRYVSKYEFRDTMVKFGFSYEGAKALFDYLEEYEEEGGKELEFDAVALGCDFMEYESKNELLEQYDNCNTLEDIEENTTLIRFNYTKYDYKKELKPEITKWYIIQCF